MKDHARLVAAYDDRQGVTAAFNRNVLHVINRELDAAFEPEAFEHVALYDEDNEWIEMRLRAARPMEVPIRALGLTAAFGEGRSCVRRSAPSSAGKAWSASCPGPGSRSPAGTPTAEATSR